MNKIKESIVICRDCGMLSEGKPKECAICGCNTFFKKELNENTILHI